MSSRRNRRSRFGRSRSRVSRDRRQKLGFESLESRQLLAVTSFQDVAGGYSATEDTILYSISPNTNFGTETSMSPDQQDANGVRQGLLKFGEIFGTQPGQIPLGSTINSATLQVSVVNSSTAQMQMSLYRMLEDWSQGSATWNSFGEIGGVQASEGEATSLPPDATLFDPNTGSKTFNVTRSLKNWAAGQANYGWLIESAATDGWDFDTSEGAATDRPKLMVNYTAPSGNGAIQFIDSELRAAEGDSGTTQIEVTVNRLGGIAGAVSATYTVAAGTAQSGDFVADTGTVNFADGETSTTINVHLNGDTTLEGNETITITLSSPTGGATIGATSEATLTIADDDALINEVLANVSANDSQNILTDETNREYVELIGTPGASLDGYYFVVFEGQEEETTSGGDATGSGVADLVVDLSGQTFGSNGLLVLKPTNWVYTAATGTNTLVVPALDAVAGGLEDDSQTYALVRSSIAIVQGIDYDTVGEFVNASKESVDTPLGSVGVLDQAPFTTGQAQLVDSVFVTNGGSDRDRAAVTADLGLPGVHVHQPTGKSDSGNVASDAVSRREGNKIPNTIGAWFNGDILDTRVDNPVIEYLNGTTRINVVAPDGSVLTPGAPNTLRNVFIESDLVSVDEVAGTATFTVTRTGDTSQAIDVAYETVDGTAQAGSDYVAQSGVLSFEALPGNVNQQTKQITITINDDGVAEGFETFGVQLTSADSPFLITENLATVTVNDADVQIASFQQGVNGYSDTLDTYIDGSQPFNFLGFSERVLVDDAAGDPEFGGAEGSDIRPQQGLIRFDDLFGAGANQVPDGAQVFGGFLTLNVLNPSAQDATIELYRMLKDWDELADWTDPQGAKGDTILNGVTPDDREVSSVADSVVTLPGEAGKVQIPLSRETLQAWSTGSLENYGWAIVSDSDSSWEFSSRNEANVDFRPELTILYTNPSGPGEFGFVQLEETVGEGSTATVTVQRLGGSSGSASIDYQVTTGTASAGDISGATSGTLTFADGELFKTFQVQTTHDTALETNETLQLTLTGGNVAAGLGAATLTIRDNDISSTNPPVLVSEIVYNQPGNDGGAELFELTGTPGAGLGSLYAVVIAGDVGPDEGATDLVVDLGSFSNGSNGTTLIGARDTFTWNVPEGTTFIGLEDLNVEFLGGADNGTSTYALVYSPLTPLHVGRFDYDWNNSGGLELPPGAQIIDSIAVRDNSATDSTYGGGANTLTTNPTQSFDAVSRLPGTTARNNAASWYGADLFGSNDALVYNAAASTNLPSTGAAVTPGETNTGTAAQNPLVQISSVDTSNDVTVNFSGNVSQVLVGDGTSFTGVIGPGISVTNTNGSVIAGVDAIPSASGLGTSSIELSFTGASTVGGQLPAGTYHLNFVGNSLVGNGRGVDVGNTSTGPSNTTLEITVAAPTNNADFDNSGTVDGFDFLSWQRGYGTTSGATKADGDANDDGKVDANDLGSWESQFGSLPQPIVVASAAEISDDSPSSDIGLIDIVSSNPRTSNVWLSLGTSRSASSREYVPVRRTDAVAIFDAAFDEADTAEDRKDWASYGDWGIPYGEETESSKIDAVDDAFAELEDRLAMV